MAERKKRTIAGDKTICLPIEAGMTYDPLVKDTKAFRADLDQLIATHPELFPVGIEQGYSKKAIAQHIESIRNIIQANKSAPQAAVLSKLNPIIRGWCNYYSTVCSKNTFRNCKNIIWLQLRAWARYRTGNLRFKTLNKYWHYIEGRLTFSTKTKSA